MAQTPMQIFLRFLRFGLLAWGGPVAQIAMIKKELVEDEKWVSKEQFNRALAVYQVLPGPEAHELCVYFGMKAGGRTGGFAGRIGIHAARLFIDAIIYLAICKIRASVSYPSRTIRRCTGGRRRIDRLRRLPDRQTCRDQ